MENKINPIRLTDVTNGVVYELDFSRESVKFAEDRQFDLDNIDKYPVTVVPQLFYYALRKNHRNMALNQADALREKLFPRGLPKEVLGRLIDLYRQAQLVNLIDTDDETGEGEAKNSPVTVEM